MESDSSHIEASIQAILEEVRKLQKKDYVTKEVNELNLKNLEDKIDNIKENYTKNDVFWKWIVGLLGGVVVGIIVCVTTHFL